MPQRRHLAPLHQPPSCPHCPRVEPRVLELHAPAEIAHQRREPGFPGAPHAGLARLRAGLDGGPVGRPGLAGLVFQGPSLLPPLDVTENVALPRILAGDDDGTAHEAARAALESVGVEALVAKLPDELSAGQLQRVAIARVLAARPALILADEPTGKLDHNNAERVITVLLDTASAIGAAVIIATHDPAVATRLPDRWVMRDGRLLTRPDPDRDMT